MIMWFVIYTIIMIVATLIGFIFFIFIFLLCNTVLVLPYIDMNPPQVYMSSQPWIPLPPSSPYHLSGSSQCTSPKHPVSCIKPRLAMKIHPIHPSFLTLILPSATAKSLQSCPTLQPHRRQPTRLLCSSNSPGKNTGLGCHFLLQCMKVKSESEVAQLCPTLSDQAPLSMGFSRQEYSHQP